MPHIVIVLMDIILQQMIYVNNVLIDVSHVPMLLNFVLLVLQTESIYKIVIALLDIMRSKTKLLALLVQVLVLHVLHPLFAHHVTPDTTFMTTHAQPHAQMATIQIQ